MTTSTPEPIERQLPVDEILGRYRQSLAQATERAIIAEATAAAAEAECASLRLRVIELEAAANDDAG